MVEKRLFRVHGNREKGTGVLIPEKQILVPAHFGFTKNDEYKVYGADQHSVVVKCIYVSKNSDFALLSSEDLEEVPMHSLHFERDFFVIVSLSRNIIDKSAITLVHMFNNFQTGLPINLKLFQNLPESAEASNPCIVSGHYLKTHADYYHWIASMNMVSGCGPVFSREGRLLGIVTGDINGNDFEHGVMILPYSGIYAVMKMIRSFLKIIVNLLIIICCSSNRSRSVIYLFQDLAS